MYMVVFAASFFASVMGADGFFAIVTDKKFAIVTGMRGYTVEKLTSVTSPPL